MLNIDYQTIKPTLKNFDLVLFKGGDFFSELISLVEKRKGVNSKLTNWKLSFSPGDFTHVGIILTNDILKDPKLDDNEIYVWESTMSGRLGDGTKNVEGKSHLGVQLRNFSNVARSYLKGKDSNIAIAPLLDEYRKNIDTTKFLDFYNETNNDFYDANAYSLLSSVFKCLRTRRDAIESMLHTTNWYFCSELVAKTYKVVNIFDDTVIPANVLPMDFIGFDSDLNIPIVVHEPYYINP